MGQHEVRQGECLSTIAADYRFDWHALWEHADNAELKKLRGDPNVLLPGDRLAIPQPQVPRKQCDTDRRHRFVLKDPSETLRIRLLDALDRPRRNLDYELFVEGEDASRTGRTDDDGELKEKVALNVASARLVVGPGKEEFELRLGFLDPLDAVTGWQARLANLGHDVGPVDGMAGPRSQGALREFQAERGLEVTGEMDDATRAKLRERHGR